MALKMRITVEVIDDNGDVLESVVGETSHEAGYGEVRLWFAETYTKVRLAAIFNRG
jgi:hypothetical protein